MDDVTRKVRASQKWIDEVVLSSDKLSGEVSSPQMVDSYGMIQSKVNTLEGLGFEYDWSKGSNSDIAELCAGKYSKARSNKYPYTHDRTRDQTDQ